MIVVADTEPINYLVLIGHIDVLEHLYGRVLIPQAVANELRATGAPLVVRTWISDPPRWLEVREVVEPDDPGLAAIDPGERQAIILSLKRRALMPSSTMTRPVELRLSGESCE